MMLSAVSFEPLRSALARFASVKSMVGAFLLLMAVSLEPLRSALASVASVKSMVEVP